MIDHWLPRNKSSIKPAIFHRHFCVSSDYLLAVSCCLQVIPYALLFLWTSFGFIFYYIFTWLSIISGSLPLSAVSYAWHSFIWTIIGFPAVLGSLALVIIVFLLIIYSSFHIFNVFLFLSVIMFVLRSISCQFHYFVQIIDDHMLYLQIIDSQSLFVQILCWNGPDFFDLISFTYLYIISLNFWSIILESWNPCLHSRNSSSLKSFSSLLCL